MKRFIAVLSGLLVLPAFAEIAPVYYDDVIGLYDAEPDDVEVVADDTDATEEVAPAVNKPVAKSPVSPRTATGGRTASRAMAAGGTTIGGGTRTVTTRGTTSRTTANTARTAGTRGTVARATVTRAATNGAAVSSAAPSATASDTTIRRSTPASTAARAAATTSIVQTDTVRTPLYTGRVGVRSNVTTRTPTIRMATATSTSGASATSTSTAASTATDMDELAQITDFCKAQYTQCMDNFCNVLDDNQGRCSCSANLKNYEKTETALKQVTEELQEVAQKIQYIGLSANEIDTLFSQTEAELRMQNTTDNTQLKNDLDRIKKLIVDVNGGKATTSETGIGIDLSGLLDFSIDSVGFNLSSLLGGGSQTTISNQRGETLYKTAVARCKAAVLNTCASQGVDTSLIANAYDLEIDKQCIAYERGLKESNEQMASTVRNAKSVLQKARLMVAQNKNSYDLRGCISALDSCMQDDYVCGSDYENCLDPTGQYIVNGEVVVGSQPGLAGGEYTAAGTAEPGLYSTWDYIGKTSTGAQVNTNAWNKGSLAAFVDNNMLKTVSEFTTSGKSDMAGYLQRKIGYIDKEGIARGMCASVLNKCQNFSYYNGKSTKKQEYNPDNQVVREYLERAMRQIKAAQDTRLADYAEDCIADVSSCLSQNNYNRTGMSYGYNTVYGDNNYSEIAIKACLPVINTCRSVTQHKKDLDNDVVAWLDEALGTNYICIQNGGTIDSSGNCVKTVSKGGITTTYRFANNAWQVGSGSTWQNVSQEQCNGDLSALCTWHTNWGGWKKDSGVVEGSEEAGCATKCMENGGNLVNGKCQVYDGAGKYYTYVGNAWSQTDSEGNRIKIIDNRSDCEQDILRGLCTWNENAGIGTCAK